MALTISIHSVSTPWLQAVDLDVLLGVLLIGAQQISSPEVVADSQLRGPDGHHRGILMTPPFAAAASGLRERSQVELRIECGSEHVGEEIGCRLMISLKVGRSTHGGSSCESVGSVVGSRFDRHEHRESISKGDERSPKSSSPAIPIGERVDAHPLAVDDGAKGYDGLELYWVAGCSAIRNDRIESEQGRFNASEQSFDLGEDILRPNTHLVGIAVRLGGADPNVIADEFRYGSITPEVSEIVVTRHRAAGVEGAVPIENIVERRNGSEGGLVLERIGQGLDVGKDRGSVGRIVIVPGRPRHLLASSSVEGFEYPERIFRRLFEVTG